MNNYPYFPETDVDEGETRGDEIDIETGIPIIEDQPEGRKKDLLKALRLNPGEIDEMIEKEKNDNVGPDQVQEREPMEDRIKPKKPPISEGDFEGPDMDEEICGDPEPGGAKMGGSPVTI